MIDRRKIVRWIQISLIGLLSSLSLGSQAYEQSVKCREVGDPDPSAYPYESFIAVGSSAEGRTVTFAVSWKADALRYISGYGLELKTHQYNYDDAATTGKGPAYVMGPADGPSKYCDLPGCYVDSDLLSELNSSGEYSEPQVAIGVEPEQSHRIIAGEKYFANIPAIVGRGNNSLMKVRYYTTTRVAPIGVSGIFHCNDVSEKNLMKFQDIFYVPACLHNKDIIFEKC